MKKLLMCAAVLCLGSGSAQAALLTPADVGESGTIFFNGNVGGQNVPQLSAQVGVTLVSYSTVTDQIVLNLTLDNTSTITSRLAAFGFQTNPDVIGASITNAPPAEYTVLVVNPGGESFPNNFGTVDLCSKGTGSNDNNCQGGASGGLLPADAPDSLTLTLTFANLTNAGVDFTNFGVRYQAITGAGFDGASGTGVGTPGGPGDLFDVPEPTSMLLLGLGLLGAGIARRRM